MPHQSWRLESVASTERELDKQDGTTVLVGASYSGSIITQAGDHPNVESLVYVVEVQSDMDESLVDSSNKVSPVAKSLLPTSQGYLSLNRKVFYADFAADIPKCEADFLSNGQMPLSVAAASAKTTVGELGMTSQPMLDYELTAS